MLHRLPLEITIPLFGIVAALLTIKPLIAKIKAGNFILSYLLIVSALLDIRHATNTIAFSGGRAESWDGDVFCDVDLRVRVGLRTAVNGALTCVVRNLASAFRTDRVGQVQTKKEKFITWGFDIILCICVPLYHVAVVQEVASTRYAIFPVAGCSITTWPDIRTLLIWQLLGFLEAIIATVYCYIGVYRFYRHRSQTSDILSPTSSGKWRLVRYLAFALPASVLYLMITVGPSLSQFTSVGWKLQFRAPTSLNDPTGIMKSPLEIVGRRVWQIWGDIFQSYIAIIYIGWEDSIRDAWKRFRSCCKQRKAHSHPAASEQQIELSRAEIVPGAQVLPVLRSPRPSFEDDSTHNRSKRTSAQAVVREEV